jgi:hypothetical protein
LDSPGVLAPAGGSRLFEGFSTTDEFGGVSEPGVVFV